MNWTTFEHPTNSKILPKLYGFLGQKKGRAQ